MKTAAAAMATNIHLLILILLVNMKDSLSNKALPRCAKTKTFQLQLAKPSPSMCLDNGYNSQAEMMANGKILQIYTCPGWILNQYYMATHGGQGFYTISHNVSGLFCLNVASETSPMATTTCDKSQDTQKWAFVPVKAPLFQLKSKSSGKCLSPQSLSNGAGMIVTPCTQAENQVWVLNMGGKGAGVNNGTGGAQGAVGNCALWSGTKLPKKVGGGGGKAKKGSQRG